MDYYFLLVPPTVVLVFIGARWIFWKRKNTFDETIAFQTEPPKGFGVLECGILLDDALNTKDISLEILNLHGKGVLVRKDDHSYALNSKAEPSVILALTAGQKLLLSTMVGDGTGGSFFTNQNDLAASVEKTPGANIPHIHEVGAQFMYRAYLERVAKRLQYFRLQMYDLLTAEGYFTASPFEQRKPYFAVGSLLVALPIIGNLFIVTEISADLLIPFSLCAGLAVAGFLLAYSSLFMVSKTAKGMKAKAFVLGLKEYIQTAEIDRIKFILENDIQAYRALLPYAGLFHSLEKWMKPLADVGGHIDEAQLHDIESSTSALDVDESMVEKSHVLRAFVDLFWYGGTLIEKFRRRKGGFRDQI